MSGHALVTLQIGRNPDFTRARQNFSAICQRHGWDFVVINKRRLGFVPLFKKCRRIQMEKFQAGTLLRHYERLMYVDSDIIIRETLPDVFAEVPATHLGCVFEDQGPFAWKRDEERRRALRKLGPCPQWTSGYFNSGVLVCSRIHQPLFSTRWRDIVGGRWADQTTLNYQARARGFPIHPLPNTYNFLTEHDPQWFDDDVRQRAHVIHYAGDAAKPYLAKDWLRLAPAIIGT